MLLTAEKGRVACDIGEIGRYCHSETEQTKAGKTRTGSQQYGCKLCNRVYTPEPKQQGYPDEMCQESVQFYLEGMSQKGIARHLGMDHKTVGHWVKAHTI